VRDKSVNEKKKVFSSLLSARGSKKLSQPQQRQLLTFLPSLTSSLVARGGDSRGLDAAMRPVRGV